MKITMECDCDRATAKRLRWIVKRAIEQKAEEFDQPPPEEPSKETRTAWAANATALREMIESLEVS